MSVIIHSAILPDVMQNIGITVATTTKRISISRLSLRKSYSMRLMSTAITEANVTVSWWHSPSYHAYA
jgi:hypothetical protein